MENIIDLSKIDLTDLLITDKQKQVVEDKFNSMSIKEKRMIYAVLMGIMLDGRTDYHSVLRFDGIKEMDDYLICFMYFMNLLSRSLSETEKEAIIAMLEAF